MASLLKELIVAFIEHIFILLAYDLVAPKSFFPAPSLRAVLLI
jgi:hypothetical protein